MANDIQSASSKLQDAAILHGISLQRVNKTLRDDVVENLIELRDSLQAKLNSTATMTDWQKQRVAGLLKFANGTIEAAYRKIGDQFSKDLNGIAAATVNHMSSAVNETVGVNISSVISLQQLQAIANAKKLLVQGSSQKDWWSKQSDDLQFKFAAVIKSGLMAGQSIGQMTGPVADLMQVSATQSEALIRTSIAEVQAEAQQTYYENNDDIIKGIQQISTLDARTTPECQARSGLSWEYPSYKPVGHKIDWNGGPPLHWNCRSTSIPVLRSWAELSSKKISTEDNQTVQAVFQQKLADQGFSEAEAAQIQMDQQSSMDGPISEDLSYEDWLKSKPETFQRQVLGQARWQLWQDGRISLLQMIDGSGTPLTIAELHQAITDNVAVPLSKASECQDGLTLGQRVILQQHLSAAAINGEYRSTWIDQSGVTVDQSLTHSITKEEAAKLNESESLVNLSNSTQNNEFWDVSELKTWAAVPFQTAKLVLPNGRVAIVNLKKGMTWTLDDVKTYETALKAGKEKYSSISAQVAYAFRKTGKVTFSMTRRGAVELDPKSLRSVYPPMRKKH